MHTIFYQHILEALSNLWLYKLRSLLTLLGVLVGTASVVALVSSGHLATEHALAQFKTLGTELLALSIENQQNPEQNMQTQKFNLDQVNKLKTSNPDILLAAPYTTDYSSISYLGKPLQGNVIGATENLARILKISLAQGRFVYTLDNEQYFAVLGSELGKELAQKGVINPIGLQIQVGNHFFTIIGVANPWPENMFMYSDINRAIIVPILSSFTISPHTRIQNILFELKLDADIDKVQQSIEKTLLQISPNSNAMFRSAKQLLESMQKQRATFSLMLGAIGGIALIVGGIGVMNIMLVSVIERRREIGIRMAIGAKRRDIQRMFLSEAIVLTLVGGLAGIIFGILVSLIIALVSHWGFRIYTLPVLIGFVVSVLVGIFFGYYPAYKASQLDPIKTLQSD